MHTILDESIFISRDMLLGQFSLKDVQWLPNAFNYPVALWLGVIPILIGAWIWNRRSRGVVLPVDHSVHGSGSITQTLIHLAESLTPLLLALVIWILAGPLLLGKPTEKRSVTNIQFCVDISGSMTARFGEGTRYDASMKAINQFLDFARIDNRLANALDLVGYR